MASGPGLVTFGNVGGLSTTASFSTAGTYDLKLTVTTGSASAVSDVIITVNAAPVVPLVVNAGTNQTITLPASANLSGNASGSCLPGCTPTVNWTMASGPGTVTFGNASLLSTTAAFSTAGTYDLKLSVTAGTASASSDVIVTVNPVSTTPLAPLVVSAGANQTISLSSSATLAGSASGNCLPGCTPLVSWTVANGPGTVTFSNPAAITTTANFSTAGTYTLQLMVTAGTASATSTVVITVSSCGVALSGTVTIAANVETSVGIAGVQFQIDGVNLGPTLTQAPYSMAWDTTTAPKGCHVVTAIATDLTGSQGNASVLAALNQ